MPLPTGLALNPATGQISGTPTAPGTYDFTLRVRDAQGNQRDIPAQIVVTAYVAPSLSGAIAGFSNRTVAYSSGLTVADGTGPYTWSIASGTLPTGLSIDTGTGVISGTPTDTSYTDRTLTIRVVDAAGSAAQSVQVLRYADVLALSGSLSAGVQSTPYSAGLTRGGGHSPFLWAITAGTLPAGLSFDTSTGVISGTPVGISSTALTIQVTDANGASDDLAATLTINSSYVAINVSGSVTSNSQNVETLSAFSITPAYGGVSVTGGSGSLTYSWARISGSTAISAGSPTSLATSFVGSVSPGASINATFRLTVSDGTSSDTLDVVITVTNTYVTLGLSATLDLATETVAYSDALSRTGGKSPYTFAVTAGTLPTGITLNASTGALTGTPTDTSGTDRNMTFRVTDALGATANVSVSLIYRRYPTLSYALGNGMRTRAYSSGAVQSGGHAGGTYALTSGTLPTGLSVNASTGAVTGTPTSTSYGPFAVTITYTDAAGNAVAAGSTLQYQDNIAISGTVGAAAYNGSAYSDSSLSAAGGFGTNVWSISAGALPAGLSINTSSGAITGTPTVDGVANFTARVVDAAGFAATSAQTITVNAALAVSSSPANVNVNFINSPASSTPSTRDLTTATLTASGTGGSGGYSYAWTRISGSSSISANSPSSAATTFTGVGVPVDGNLSAVFRVTVTDSGARTATSDKTISINYSSGL
jgi:hypothetical protein